MIRHGIALGALTAALAAAGVVAAQQPEPTPATPAPEVAAPTLPAAPIPYNQLRRPPSQAVEEEAEPEEEEEAPEPLRRPRAGAAILQALDKVTAETMRFEARIGQPVRYKGLIFTVRACETAAPDELAPATAAYVVVDSQPRTRPGQARRPARQVFRGWMFANSPSLNPLEHPVYDAWLIACKTAGPSPENR